MAEGQPSKLSFTEMVRGSHLDENAAPPPSSYKGEPALILSDQEVTTLSSPLRFAFIGKFLTDRPSMEFLRKGFKTIGFKGDFHLGLMDRKHILIRFDLEEDYHRCWLHGSWNFKDYVMRVLKWTSDFSVAEEPPVVPVWVSLEHLPLYLFARGPLFSIGRLIGQPMKIDAATLSLSRPSVARVCVEVDLRRSLPSRLWIGHPGGGFWQPIAYDSLPAYCFDCRTLGHLQKDCGKQITCAPPVREQQVWKPKEKQTAHIDDPAASKVVAGQPEESTPTDNPLMPSIIAATPAANTSAAETPHAAEDSLVSPAAEEPASTSQPINITTNKSALKENTQGVCKNAHEISVRQAKPAVDGVGDTAVPDLEMGKVDSLAVDGVGDSFVVPINEDRPISFGTGGVRQNDKENEMAPTQKATALNPNASEFQFPKVAVNEIERVPSNPTDERQTANFYIELNPNMGKSVVNLTSEEIDAIREEVQRSIYHEDFTQGFNKSQFEDDLEDEEWIQEEEEVYWDNEFIRDDSYLRRGRGRSSKKKASVPHSMRRRSSKSLD